LYGIRARLGPLELRAHLGGPCHDWSTTRPFSKISVRSQRSAGCGEPTGMPTPNADAGRTAATDPHAANPDADARAWRRVGGGFPRVPVAPVRRGGAARGRAPSAQYFLVRCALPGVARLLTSSVVAQAPSTRRAPPLQGSDYCACAPPGLVTPFTALPARAPRPGRYCRARRCRPGASRGSPTGRRRTCCEAMFFATWSSSSSS